MLGRLLYHIVFPYLCVELSLSEQLEHLSAAAHLAFVLFRESGKDFLPTLLFGDFILMVKNTFFCIAKAKVDDPEGFFWLILLGTDRLEELFGILRTMIGNDCNLDILQLTGRITGTTEVSNILAKYPHWDRAPRRLKLPAITRESKELPDKADHIKPASWRGDVAVKNVTLITSWKRGRRIIEDEYAFAKAELLRLDAMPNVGMLSPHGVLLVDVPLAADDNEDDDDIISSSAVGMSIDIPEPNVAPSLSPDLKDAVAGEPEDVAELPRAPLFDKFTFIGGKKLAKSRALALRSKYNRTTSSTDRLKRVQEIERYSESYATPRQSISEFDSAFGAPCLMLQEPIATLIRCQKRFFLCLGEVNDIKIDGESAEHVGLDILVEDTVRVSYQVLGLIPTTSDDGAEPKHDWRSCAIPERSFTVPGRFVQSINPDISTRNPGKPFYLLESSVLIALSATLFERLSAPELKLLPKITASREVPYREASGLIQY
jgi:hypothetical protein